MGEFFRQLREFLATSGGAVSVSYAEPTGLLRVEASGVGLEAVIPPELYGDDGAALTPAERSQIVTTIESIVEIHNAAVA